MGPEIALKRLIINTRDEPHADPASPGTVLSGGLTSMSREEGLAAATTNSFLDKRVAQFEAELAGRPGLPGPGSLAAGFSRAAGSEIPGRSRHGGPA